MRTVGRVKEMKDVGERSGEEERKRRGNRGEKITEEMKMGVKREKDGEV